MVRFNHPTTEQIPALWALWQEAFGDEDEYLEIFYSKAFSQNRCMQTEENGKALAALYWFDCREGDQKLAYIFGVAVAPSARGKGYCRALMNATFDRLAELGYDGAVLVPARPSLYEMYEKLGFEKFLFPEIYSYMTYDNITSFRVAEKNGMKLVFEYFDEADGKMLKVYKITKEEWEMRK